MATYFKGEVKLTVANTVDVNNALIVPPSGNGTYNFYQMPSTRFGLFQLLQSNLTGSGGQGTILKALTRGAAYTNANTIIKTLQAGSFSFGIQNYAAQLVTHKNIPALDPFSYLRTLEALIDQADLNAHCALLGPSDFMNLVTSGFDPDNSLYLSYRVYEFDIF